MKRKKVAIQVLSHGGRLGIDSNEQAEIRAVLGNELDISFLPSVQLDKKGLTTRKRAFTTTTIIIIVGILSFYFLKSFVQGLGDELGRGLGKTLKELGRRLWQGRRDKTYSLKGDLVYVFTYKGVDCALCIIIPPNQPMEETSKALDDVFSQAPQQLKELMSFIDQNIDIAQQSKDETIPLIVTSTVRGKKGSIMWHIRTDSKRDVFYSGLSLI